MIEKQIRHTKLSISAFAAASIFAFPVFSNPAPLERHPVNCATAQGDLRAIAAEKKHAEAQQAESVVAILPAGALLGLITGTEHKRLEMLSGDYIKLLDQRAAEIKEKCDID